MSNVTNLDRAAAKLAKAKKTSPPSGGTFDSDGRRVIRHDAGRLPEILDQIEDAIAAAPEHNVFRYAGRIARVYQADEPSDKAVKRPAGAIMVHPVEAPLLAELASRAALHEKYDARTGGYKTCDCPLRMAIYFLARGHYPKLPDLQGFIEAPTITAAGRIIDQPGYDAESGLFCAFTTIPGYVRPASAPTMREAEQALGKLLGLFASFPFVDDIDRAAMLAGLLTALQRRLLPSAPLLGITAPAAGTGKTQLCETLAIVITNRRASVLSLGHDDAETEKRLTGVLLAGDAVINLDNIEHPLRGDLLCQISTQTFVRLRPLGGSGMLSVPTHAVLIATGNNLSIIGDLKRRVVMIRLDAKVERPEHRSFDRDHLQTVAERRGEIITYGLTIVAAYLAAGAPPIAGLHAFGGFEAWDRLVRRPLIWLGLPDPLQTSEELRAADPDLEGMRLVYSAWHEEFSSRPVTVAEVISAASSLGQSANDELRDALHLVCSEKPTGKRLGGWLQRHRERIIDGLQLKRAGEDSHKKVARWTVVKCG